MRSRDPAAPGLDPIRKSVVAWGGRRRSLLKSKWARLTKRYVRWVHLCLKKVTKAETSNHASQKPKLKSRETRNFAGNLPVDRKNWSSLRNRAIQKVWTLEASWVACDKPRPSKPHPWSNVQKHVRLEGEVAGHTFLADSKWDWPRSAVALAAERSFWSY